MPSLKFKQFTKAYNLKGIGRPLLGRFFAQFQQQLPSDSLDDDEYYSAL